MKNNMNQGYRIVTEYCPICVDKSYEVELILNSNCPEEEKQGVDAFKSKDRYKREPCKTCQDWKSNGFILIGVIDSLTTSAQNPYRSGQIWVISFGFAERALGIKEKDKELGFAYIDVDFAKELGLPMMDKLKN